MIYKISRKTIEAAEQAAGEDRLRSSGEWEEILGVTVLDPDGWDRMNFRASWSEPITRGEFNDRAANSTIRMDALRGRL